tara:strand:- start:54049 stop:54780 length:732 start_codon:yes stop_codon:yes gene_type:complete
MKKLTFLILIISHLSAFAQVGIGTTVVDPSAILQIESTEKGILYPSMTTLERNLLVLPANGLLIYNTDTNSFDCNRGTPAIPNWTSVHNKLPTTSYSWQSAKYSNIDITTNINPTTAIDLPVFGNEEWNDNSSLFSVTANTITIGEPGRYKINVNVSIVSTSTQARKAPEIYLTLNNVAIQSIASTGYMRRNNGHESSSLHLNEVLELNATDVLAVKIVGAGNSNSAVLRSTGSSNFYIEKVF